MGNCCESVNAGKPQNRGVEVDEGASSTNLRYKVNKPVVNMKVNENEVMSSDSKEVDNFYNDQKLNRVFGTNEPLKQSSNQNEFLRINGKNNVQEAKDKIDSVSKSIKKKVEDNNGFLNTKEGENGPSISFKVKDSEISRSKNYSNDVNHITPNIEIGNKSASKAKEFGKETIIKKNIQLSGGDTSDNIRSGINNNISQAKKEYEDYANNANSNIKVVSNDLDNFGDNDNFENIKVNPILDDNNENIKISPTPEDVVEECGDPKNNFNNYVDNDFDKANPKTIGISNTYNKIKPKTENLLYQGNKTYNNFNSKINSQNPFPQFDPNNNLKSPASLQKNNKDNPSNISSSSNNNIKENKILEPKMDLYKTVANNNGGFHCIKTLVGHNEKIVSLTELSSGKIASGSYDSTIKIWDIDTEQCEKTINENGKVLCLLEFESNRLLSGNGQKEINLWDINNPYDKPIKSFLGHELWVNCLAKINNQYFASGSNDSTIRIWDYQNGNCSKILEGHTDCILALIVLNDGRLCSGGADLTIKIWDLESKNAQITLKSHKKWIKCLYQLQNGLLLSGSDDKLIKVWDLNTCKNTLPGHNHAVRTFCQIDDNYFASGSFDHSIRIWRISDWTCVQILEAHVSNVIAIIKTASGNIVSCSNDRTIKVWAK